MGRKGPRRGIYYGDRAWLDDTGFTWFPSKPFQSTRWQSADSREAISIRLVHKIAERVCPPVGHYGVGSATAVFVADGFSGENQMAEQVIVKIFQRIPNIQQAEGKEYVSHKDLFSRRLPISENYADEEPNGYKCEREILKYLTDHQCAYTPSLITSFIQEGANPWVKGGFLGFIVMEKLSAVTISEIWEDSPRSEAQLREQLTIQERFKAAFVEIANLGVYSTDQAARNLMWNPELKKCYWIDFELAFREDPVPIPKTWDQLISRYTHPLTPFCLWDIIMEFQNLELQEALKPRYAKAFQ